jgi:hypothetical protein
MRELTVGPAAGSRRPQRDWLTAGVVGIATGVGLGAAFGVLQATCGWSKHNPDRAPSGAQIATVPIGAPAVDLAPSSAAEPHPAIAQTESTKNQVDPARRENLSLPQEKAGDPEKKSVSPIAQSPRLPAPAPAPATILTVSGLTDRFTLSPPQTSIPAPVVLPKEPWFALADLTADEPESCQGKQAVCAVNRSLNTALTWAKSPAEAAEEAEREGKLVFLIHVSGNFENPGFT